jgi:hypothetical protein
MGEYECPPTFIPCYRCGHYLIQEKKLFPSGRQNDENIKKERPEFEVKPKQLLFSGSGGMSVTRQFEEAITGTLMMSLLFVCAIHFTLNCVGSNGGLTAVLKRFSRKQLWHFARSN